MCTINSDNNNACHVSIVLYGVGYSRRGGGGAAFHFRGGSWKNMVCECVEIPGLPEHLTRTPYQNLAMLCRSPSYFAASSVVI